MGYILPINDYQVAQYLNRSLSNKKHYSFINNVQNVKRESRFRKRIKESAKCLDKSLYSHLEIKSNSLHPSSHDNKETVVGKGLYYNIYV